MLLHWVMCGDIEGIVDAIITKSYEDVKSWDNLVNLYNVAVKLKIPALHNMLIRHCIIKFLGWQEVPGYLVHYCLSDPALTACAS